MRSSCTAHIGKTLTCPGATLVSPDLTTFCWLAKLGLEVTSQRVERCEVLAFRGVWCRRAQLPGRSAAPALRLSWSQYRSPQA